MIKITDEGVSLPYGHTYQVYSRMEISMASKYGFMTEEEVKQAIEQEKETLNERRKKERERLEPIVTEILEDFATACGFYKGALVRGDGTWSVMQGENALVTVALAGTGQSEDFSLSITDEMLLRSKAPHILRNQSRLGEVLTKATGLKVTQNLPYYEPETS
jgi:hypothetical protein